MKKILYIIILLGLASCTKVLDKNPEASFATSNFYVTSADAVAAINAVYNPLISQNIYNQIMWAFQDQSTDDAEWGNGRNTANQAKNDLDKYTFTPSTVYFYAFWTTCYKAINLANTAIDRIPGINMDEALKNRLIGEAKFMRGFYYFTLVRLFGPVPLVTTPTVDLQKLQVPRTSVDSVYQQIIQDFQQAADALPEQYTGEDLGRATKGAAISFLSSVYLTTKQWKLASDRAKEVISMETKGIYGLWDNYADVFAIKNKNGKESVFDVQALGGGFGLGSYMQGYMRATFDNRGYGDDPPTKDLYDAYASNDIRRTVNLKLYDRSVAPASVLFPCYVYKYQDPNATANAEGSNNFPIFRYAEVLLIYAEALNEQGAGNQEAYDAIDRIRSRAGLDPLPRSLSQEDFRDSVLKERRLELAFEGHRRYDLIRTGRLVAALKKQNPAIKVQAFQTLFPIPQDERDANPLLTQNEGY